MRPTAYGVLDAILSVSGTCKLRHFVALFKTLHANEPLTVARDERL